MDRDPWAVGTSHCHAASWQILCVGAEALLLCKSRLCYGLRAYGHCRASIHCVRLVPPAPALQYFLLTSLQLQPPATSQVTVFFSHNTPAPASSSNLPNAVFVYSSE